MVTPRNQDTNFWTLLSSNAQLLLAIVIIGLSLAGIRSFCESAIRCDKANAMTVLNAVLPLAGTWIGTILAFYYSKENYESAAKSMESIWGQGTQQERLRSIRVGAVMTQRSRLYACDDLMGCRLQDALGKLSEKDVRNLPLLSPMGSPINVPYDVDILTYI